LFCPLIQFYHESEGISVEFGDSLAKLSNAPVSRMTYVNTRTALIFYQLFSNAPNSNYHLGAKNLKEAPENVLGAIDLSLSGPTVGQGLTRPKWMKRIGVPNKRNVVDFGNHFPNSVS
jgi:hypothetical protein